ncbi:MAG: hypothetical protein AAFX06_08715 [Planctomycetota bacterium]
MSMLLYVKSGVFDSNRERRGNMPIMLQECDSVSVGKGAGPLTWRRIKNPESFRVELTGSTIPIKPVRTSVESPKSPRLELTFREHGRRSELGNRVVV